MAEKFEGANPFKIPRAIQNVGGVRQATISGAETWTLAYSTKQILDGGLASRTITLPTAHPGIDGLGFQVYNAGATNDIILSDGGNVVTISPGEWAEVVTEGTDWILAANSGSPTTTNADSVVTYWGTGNDIGVSWDGTRLNVTQAAVNSEIRWGVDGAGIDQMFYGDTASTYATWDQSRDTFRLSDAAILGFGTGAGAAADIEITWSGTALNVTQLTANSAINLGVDGAGIDLVLYGDTAGEKATWDQSADALVLTALVSITGQGSTVVPLIPIAAAQALSGAGAINITTYRTNWTTTAADAGTLANGAQKGQLKRIQMIVDGGDGTLTPTSLSGGTTITFADAGDYAVLCWNGTAWVAIELGNDADGATAPVLA